MNPFKGRHFQRDIIWWAVRWYCKYGISYRELQEMLAERGVNVDHSTIYRWVQRYAPEMKNGCAGGTWRNPSDLCPWHMHELTRRSMAAGRICTGPSIPGAALSIFISSRRNSKAAYRFLGTLNNVKKWQIPDSSTRIKRPPMVARLLCSDEGRCPSDVEHRQIKYRNNVIECDHGKLKRIINATLGFKSMKNLGHATIKGIEVMRALRKGQASAFYYGDPLGERAGSRVFEM
ncbi:IS6 family transposase [Klebsiella pneumoniae]